MKTPFLPVTTVCPKCQRLYVEWWTAESCEGKTKLWRPKVSCDTCYAPHMNAADRAKFVDLMIRRRRNMHREYKDADLTFLDIVHKEMWTSGRDLYISNTLPYSV